MKLRRKKIEEIITYGEMVIIDYARRNFISNIRFKLRNLNIFLILFFIFDLVISIWIIDGIKYIELNSLMAGYFYTRNYLPLILMKFSGLFFIIYILEYTFEHIFYKAPFKILNIFYYGVCFIVIVMGFIILNGLILKFLF